MNKVSLLCFLYDKIRNLRIKRFLEKKIANLEGGYAYSQTIRKIYKNNYGLTIGYGTYGGCFNNSALFHRNIKIGNYCSFAPTIYISTANHPINIFTSHPITYETYNGIGIKKRNLGNLGNRHLVIGNDVWVGQNVIITSNCHHIGNGVVIGAGSIVTKDIPDYAIVVGNPAKIIKYRFSEEKIKKIELTQWWELDKKELSDKIDEYLNITQEYGKE